MKRPALTIMILGVIVTLVGGAGIFAVFTDRATTGTNSLTSGELPRAADLQIAMWPNTADGCGAFTDDLTTGLLTATDVQAGYSRAPGVCLKNAGSSDLHVSMSVIDLVDVETGCTGDEGAGDTTCGPDATPPVGELSSALFTGLTRYDCTTTSLISFFDGSLADPGLALDGGTVPAGEVACYLIGIAYDSGVPSSTKQRAQSDQTTWRFAFDGTTA